MISATDRAEILDLYGRYAHLWDAGEAEAWADLFTTDGIWERVAPSGSVEELAEAVHIEGRDGLVQFCNTLFEIEQGQVRHWATNHVIDGDSREATAKVYAMIVDLRDGAPTISVTGLFTDELCNEGNGWRFRRRSVVLAP